MLTELRSWIAQKLAPPGMAVGVLPGRTGTPVKRGTPQLLQAYNDMPWLRAVVNKVGRTIGMTNWTLYTVRRGGRGRAIRMKELQRADPKARKTIVEKLRKQGDLVPIEENAALDVLYAGNDMLTGVGTLQTIQNHLDLVGEGFLVKVRGALNQPTSLWPIPPHWCTETPFLDGNNDSFLFAYRGWSMRIKARDVIWFKDVDPFNPYGRGSGTARALADELEADEFAAKHISAFFRNNARPDVVVGLKGTSWEDAKAFEAKWLEKFQGIFNRRRPLVAPADQIDIKELGQTFEEIQLVPLRQHERDSILQVYGFPPEIFGILASSNRATIESAEFLYTKHVVDPRQEFLRSMFQQYLIPDFDDRLVLDYETIITEDNAHRLSVMTASPWAYTVDEWREEADREELSNGKGKVHPLPFNLFFDDISVATAPEPEPEPEPEPSPDEPGTEPAPDDDGDADEGDELDPDEGDSNDPAETSISGRGKGNGVKPFRRRAHKQLTQENLVIFLRLLEDRRNRTTAWGMVGVTAQQIVRDFGQEALEEIGAEINFQATDRVSQYLRDFATNRSRIIDHTTQGYLREVLAAAIERGDSRGDMVKAIRGVYSDATKSRAFMIARTETTRAANFGQQESFIQAGIERKEWLATQDTHVRDSHGDLDGQVVDTRASFVITVGPNAGATAEHPGDFGIAGEDINCLLPGTKVEGLFTGALKAFYAGPAVEIKTANGRCLSVTANHPVLTKSGFIPAKFLAVGDNLLGYSFEFERFRSVLSIQNKDNIPASAEQVFSALSNLVFGAIEHTNRSYDLHGDGRFVDGNINIIDMERELWDYTQSLFPEQFGKFGFMQSDRSVTFTSALAELFGRNLHTSSCCPSSFHLPFYEFPIFFDGLPFMTLGLGSAPKFNPHLFEFSREGASLYSGISSQLNQSRAFDVAVGQDFNIDTGIKQLSLGLRPHSHTSLPKGSVQRVVGDARLFHELLEGASSSVSADEVVEVRRFDYCGHVHDLQTPNGYFIANGVVLSNCRCSAVARMDEQRSMYDTAEKRVGAWKRFEARRLPAERVMRRSVVTAFRRQEQIMLDKFNELVEGS